MRLSVVIGFAVVSSWACDDGEGGDEEPPEADAAAEADAAPMDMPDARPLPPDALPADAGDPPDANLRDQFVPPDSAVPCGEENPCGEGEVCDEGTGECREAGTCEEDADCPGSRVCVEGRCPEADPCADPQDCDEGRVCEARACTDACLDDGDCPEDSRCDLPTGRCELGAGCAEDADCPGARTCEVETGDCLEPAVCQADDECDLGRRCIDGGCATPCELDDDCPNNQVCDVEGGRCHEPDVCLEDGDCMGVRVCEAGACGPPCQEDGDCDEPQVCAVETGHCVEPGGCEDDAACDADRICRDGECVDPECLVNDDCDGACVDFACADAAPRACEVDNDCDGDLTCVDLGACLLEDRCRAQADCPAGASRCDIASGLCVACRDDADCAPAERCDLGGCVLLRDCADDDDCPGDRICDQQQACVPLGGCAGDPFDVDDAPSLVTRTYTGLILCDGETDAYDAASVAGSGMRVVLRHDPAEGDLALSVTDFAAGEPGGAARESDGFYGVEVVEVPPRDEARQLQISVSGRAGTNVGYALTLERVEADGCVQDPLEGLAGNDDARNARLVAPGAGIGLTICPGDEDWFAVEIEQASTLTVRAAAPDAVDDLELHILDGAEVVAVGETVGEQCNCFIDENGDEQCDCQPDDGTLLLAAAEVEPGRYFVRVRGRDAQIERAVVLGIEVDAAAGDVPAICREPFELEAGERLALGESEFFDAFDVGCGFGMGADYVARFELAEAATVTVGLTGDEFNTAIAIRRDCGDPDTEAACASGQDPTIDGAELDAGTWYVMVKGGFGAMPALDLRVE